MLMSPIPRHCSMSRRASAASSTIQSAETAAQRGHPDRSHIFDTANAAGGQALLVIAAAEAAQRGASPADILATLERLRPLTRTWAIARDISHAVRGGRVPAWAKPVVQTLGLTPIARVKPEGKLAIAGGLLGKRRV